jgi:transformation/transcription domain-associated protein
MRAQAVSLMNLMIHLLRVENEENAVVCVKIIIDLHRSYKDILSSTADDFLSFVKAVYDGMEDVVLEVFGGEDAEGEDDESAAGTPSTPGHSAAAAAAAVGGTPHTGPLPVGMRSFKVLTECPIAIVFLFQNYRHLVMKEVAAFTPHILKASFRFCFPSVSVHRSLS